MKWWPRAGGLLLHPTSLPGPYGVGDLGPATTVMLDFLRAGKQKLWQVLPLAPTGYGNSPYAGLSAFAGNPLIISPQRLVDQGLLEAADLRDHPRFPAHRVDFGAVIPWRLDLLRASHTRFKADAGVNLQRDVAVFCADQAHWLEDYALFAALKEAHDLRPWVEWPASLALRDEAALAQARARYADDIAFHRYVQFLFASQWAEVRAAAHARGILIIGDLPIFVAHDSADVWAHPELFRLDARGQPTVVAGVPPDYFSKTGQRWGNPLYRWDLIAETRYAWWIARVRHARELVDIIRLDHFRGFQAYWEIPAANATAVRGAWAPGPSDALFRAIRAALGSVPFIAEDLGVITPDVVALRKRHKLPGMRVLQFAFGGDVTDQHLPHEYTRDTVVYTGTHDNDTSRGWFAAAPTKERAYALRYLHTDPEHVVPALIRAAFASVARFAIVPLQDALDLGSAARMNFPSRASGNWEWRCTASQLSPELSQRLAELATLYGR
jgi:4-alpha-glucanotransferase